MSVTENTVVFLRYQWDLEEREEKEKEKSITIISKYHKDKAFVACLTSYDYRIRSGSHPSQLLLLTNSKILGMTAVSAEVMWTSSLMKMDAIAMDKVSDVDEFSTGGLQLFVKSVGTINHAVKQTFTFNIRATSCVDDHQIKLIDSLLKRQLWMNRERQQQSDVVLMVNNRSYPCHKAILAARSSIFLEKFIADPNLKEAAIEADPLTSKADVEQFLEFLYTGQFNRPLISKQLSLLAKTFEIKTLVKLCDCAQREITMMHLMNLAVQVEPYQLQTHNAVNYGEQLLPTVETSCDVDEEVPLDLDILLTLKCSCMCFLSSFAHLDATRKQSVTLATFEYRNEPMFHCKMTKLDYGKYFALFFTGVEVEKMGFKIAEVTYSILEVGLERHKMEAKCTHFEKHIQIFKACPPKELDETFEIVFYVKLCRSTRNFDYQLVDELWTQQLWMAAQTKQLTDVEFVVDERAFAAHRFIVSARSPVFAAMFSSEMIEANTGTVVINDTDPVVFETFLKFLYIGALEPFPLVGDERLRALADKYQVETLLRLCKSFPSEVNKEELIGFIMCS